MPVIRKRIAKFLVAGVLAWSVCSPSLAVGEIIRVSTLNWPPYTGKDLPLGGATTDVVRAAFEKVGHEIEVNYRPWKRQSIWPKRARMESSLTSPDIIVVTERDLLHPSRLAMGLWGSRNTWMHP